MYSIRHLARPLSLWLESENYLKSRQDDILMIGRQQTLENDFETLKEALDLHSAELPRGEVEAHISPSTSDRYLSEEAVRNVVEWYAGDCLLYDQCLRMAPKMGYTHKSNAR